MYKAWYIAGQTTFPSTGEQDFWTINSSSSIQPGVIGALHVPKTKRLLFCSFSKTLSTPAAFFWERNDSTSIDQTKPTKKPSTKTKHIFLSSEAFSKSGKQKTPSWEHFTKSDATNRTLNHDCRHDTPGTDQAGWVFSSTGSGAPELPYLHQEVVGRLFWISVIFHPRKKATIYK